VCSTQILRGMVGPAGVAEMWQGIAKGGQAPGARHTMAATVTLSVWPERTEAHVGPRRVRREQLAGWQSWA
jgi:hypothetical protein